MYVAYSTKKNLRSTISTSSYLDKKKKSNFFDPFKIKLVCFFDILRSVGGNTAKLG